MKLLADSKWLCALLAVVTVGMGVQTYYLVQVHRKLDAEAAHTAEPERAAEAQVASTEQEAPALAPGAPQPDGAARAPLARSNRAEERMRSLFDSFYDRLDRDWGAGWIARPPLSMDGFGGASFLLGDGSHFGPRVDLQDRGDRYEWRLDVPGADETDVVVRAEDGVLIVEGTRRSTTEESEPGNYVRRERHFGRFQRRLSLPGDAATETLRTALENGVLTVTLQKKSRPTPYGSPS